VLPRSRRASLSRRAFRCSPSLSLSLSLSGGQHLGGSDFGPAPQIERERGREGEGDSEFSIDNQLVRIRSVSPPNPSSLNIAGVLVVRGGVVLHRNVKRFRGGLVFKAHRLLYHSTLGSRVVKKKKKVMRELPLAEDRGERPTSLETSEGFLVQSLPG